MCVLHSLAGAKIHAENKKTNVLVCHGNSDQVVNPKAGAKAVETLQAASVPVAYHKYPNMGHSTCNAEMRTILEFLQTQLPPASSAAASAPAAASAAAATDKKN